MGKLMKQLQSQFYSGNFTAPQSLQFIAELTELQQLNLEGCIKQAEELAFKDDYEARRLRWFEKILNEYSHVLEKRNDEMYSSRFFRQYNVQKQNLKKLKEIVGLKKCLLSNRIVLETRCSEFDFIDYLKEIEIKGMKQRRVIEILKGNTDQLRWQDRLEKSWDEIEGIDDRVFLEKLGEGIRRCVSEGYLADKFRDSYIQDTAERLVVNIQRKIKG